MSHVARGCYPSGCSSYVQAPAYHSFSKSAKGRICHFTGQNTEATRYPSTNAFHRCMVQIGLPNSVFGIVSQDTYRQALTGLSWLSYSHSRFVAGYPNLVQGPAPTVASRRLPTPAHVARTRHNWQARAPWADLQPLVKATHRLRHMTSSTTRSRSFRIAPIRGATLSDRTSGLL